MKSAHYHWEMLPEKTLPENYDLLLKKYGLGEKFSQYAYSLGLKSEEDFRRFFSPQIEDLHDPSLLYDLNKSVQRIRQGILENEQILIYGDYDADGITSTTVLKEAIEMVGGNVLYYLPNRFKDGYGPNKRVYEEFIDFGINLIITVDNGVSGHEAISYAKSRGVDVIVTDHHEMPEVLPDAYSIVHPRHPLGNYPYPNLAGVGVSFKVACALLEEVPQELLELVAIGTIADLVPLTGENRTLVQLGLQQLHFTDRQGLHALFQLTSKDISQANEEDIAFQIAPRLNALGRLSDASLGVELLSSFHEEEVKLMAQTVEKTNLQRKDLVKETVIEALEQVSKEDAISFVAKENWHEGILGIVAGNLLQKRHVPSFVLTINEETKIAKGSARSVEGFNLYEAISQCQELFTAFGGHHMAAGFSLPVENLPLFKEKMSQAFLNSGVMGEKEKIKVTFSLRKEDLSLEFYQQMNAFAPFGNAHEKPHVLLKQQKISDPKTLSEGAHLKFSLEKENETLQVIAFQFGQEFKEFNTNNLVDLLCDLGQNEWRGKRTLQLSLLDFAISGWQVFDYRSQKNHLPDLEEEKTWYLVFDEKDLKRLSLTHKKIMLPRDLEPLSKEDNLVLVDCPTSLSELKELILKSESTRLFLWCYTYEQAYLNGLPKREEFGTLFKFFRQQKNLDVRYKSHEAAEYLKFSYEKFIFMTQVFSQLNFVTIENGLLNVIENPVNQDLFSSTMVKNYQKKMKTEEFLLYTEPEKIAQWLENKEEHHES